MVQEVFKLNTDISLRMWKREGVEGGRNVIGRQQAHRRTLMGMRTKLVCMKDRGGKQVKLEYEGTK